MPEVFAVEPTSIFGTVAPPIGGYSSTIEGLTQLITNILSLAFLGAGVWAFLNFIIAGYSFLSASGDPKKITAAWERIWQSIVGLVVIVASFILAAIVGWLVFGDPLYILKPKIFGPSST